MPQTEYATNGNQTVRIVDAGQGAETVYLPRNFATGRSYVVRRRDSGVAVVTVAAQGNERIDNDLTSVTIDPDAEVTFVCVNPGQWESVGLTLAKISAAIGNGGGGGGGGAVSSVVGQTGAITGAQILADSAVAGALTAKAAASTVTAGLAAKADDSAVVHNTGSETIAGAKTFSSSPTVPTPSSGGHAATKAYVDGVGSSGSTPDADSATKGKVRLTNHLGGTADAPTVPGLAAKADDTAVVHKTGTETIAGDKTISGTLTVPTPTNSGHAVTKAYADAISVGGGSTPDADSSTKGKIKLGGGDLGGTADAVTVPGLAAKADSAAMTTALAGKAPLIEGVSGASGGTAYTIPATSVATLHEVTLNAANCTLTFPTATPGASFTLVVRQDGTGGRTVTWPGANIVWFGTGSTEPTLATTAGKLNILTFTCLNSGYWLGTYAGSN